VRFSGLVPGSQQLDMFEDSVEMANLYQAMDRLRMKYGNKVLGRAVGLKSSEVAK
jgi:DNA polymerase-4